MHAIPKKDVSVETSTVRARKESTGGNAKTHTEVTMDVVAEKANVSRSTVSRALRNHPSIPYATKERVREIARRLGYRPNPLVAALMSQLKVSSKTNNASHPIIALVSSFPINTGWQNNPSVTRMVDGAFTQAEKLGFRLCTFHLAEPGMTDTRLSQILYTRGIQGVIILPMKESGSRINLDWSKFSSTTLGYSLMHPKLHRVCNHLTHTIANALDNVIRLGYQRIGLAMKLDTDDRVDHAWRSGYALYREMFSSIKFSPMLLTTDWNRLSFEKWFLENKPEAVISDDIQVRQWLKEIKYSHPQKVGIVMLDYSQSHGNCAGIDQHHEILGAAAVDLVVGQLYRNETGIPPHPKYVTIEGSWVDGTNRFKSLSRHVAEGNCSNLTLVSRIARETLRPFLSPSKNLKIPYRHLMVKFKAISRIRPNMPWSSSHKYAPMRRAINYKTSESTAAFGTNVRRERMNRKITQEKLAEMVDLNIRTVQKIEAGAVNILLTTVLRLQKALGCRWDELMSK